MCTEYIQHSKVSLMFKAHWIVQVLQYEKAMYYVILLSISSTNNHCNGPILFIVH